MTIEEKAKAYDEAIKIAKETYNTQPMYRNWLESMFPELQENEIKDMREKLIKAFGSIGKKEWGGVNVKDVIHWLEKQGEQKPAEWSEEDEVKINRIVDCLENLNVADNDILLKDVDWLKSLLRNRVKPQPDMVEALRTEYEKGKADGIAEMKIHIDIMDKDNIDDFAYQCAYDLSKDWLYEHASWDDVQIACKLGAKWYEDHHKAQWSEEDENILNNLIDYIKVDDALQYSEKQVVNWLKQLKQRIGG